MILEAAPILIVGFFLFRRRGGNVRHLFTLSVPWHFVKRINCGKCFLVADTQLYNIRGFVRPSVRPSVRSSVRPLDKRNKKKNRKIEKMEKIEIRDVRDIRDI